ncbi:cytochrome b5-like heme steroid binding domain-containing protein [Rutstroemia sp. NJR-2017a WRK4]|nr:cytochrome b5-like heme steroid binding domain-containing protein [Rutstroemia sp. NJR-2017a WRK4]
MADTAALRERRKQAVNSSFGASASASAASSSSSDSDADSPALTKTKTNIAKKPKSKSPNQYASDEDAPGITLLDILRSIVFVVVASCGLSYVVTRNSWVWGVERPAWLSVEGWKGYWNGPLQLTDLDLPQYSGTAPDTPIYLAINGSIYDVSAGRKHYGPGGSYHFFAGADASRAFVTQCFTEDRTPDMRGVEKMFLPLDDEETDREIEAKIGKKGMKVLRERENREARKKVKEALGHWTSFFENSPKYPKIGTVKREPGWETKGPEPTLCERAEKGRKKRTMPTGI